MEPMVTDVGPQGCLFNYHVTAHKPTAVRHCAVGSFTSPNETNLVIGRSTHLDIQVLTPEGLKVGVLSGGPSNSVEQMQQDCPGHPQLHLAALPCAAESLIMGAAKLHSAWPPYLWRSCTCCAAVHTCWFGWCAVQLARVFLEYFIGLSHVGPVTIFYPSYEPPQIIAVPVLELLA
eukprot:GHRQ01035267.1.p1 GENE.GHRQ01035267.1~~GHRQ01035267.1.p1  ORF type:complete len:176 (+),score=1.09 GHRQ01035267.1:283-810(+)